MKSIFLYFLLAFITLPAAFAQDLIITNSGNELAGKVVEVLPTAIRFSQADSVFTVQKANIFMIKYADGSKVLFDSPAVENVVAAETPVVNRSEADSLSRLGDRDARTYYRAYKNAASGTFVSSLLFPPAGLVVAISTSSTRPSRANLNYPSESLFRKPAYKNGYGERAHKKKQEQVWTNFGFGLGAAAVLSIFVPKIIQHF